MNRFQFLTSVFGAGAGSLLGPAEGAETSLLGRADVVSWQHNLSRLYELEAEYGGGVVYELAIRTLRRLRRMLQRAGSGTSTADELRSIEGELAKHAGWLAFDAGWHAEARYWWLEASHMARFLDDDRLLVGVLRQMSQQAKDLDRPQEAVELAQAAQRAARPWATARLRSNLAAREAAGYARAGDEQAARQAFHQAEALFGTGPHDDDPPWLYHWDEADLASCTMCAALSLGQLPLADRSGRAALAAVRPDRPRNRVSYLTHHAAVLVKQRNIEEAVSTAAQAVAGSTEVSSARIDTRIAQVRTGLAQHANQPQVSEFLDWSRQIMAAKTNVSTIRI